MENEFSEWESLVQAQNLKSKIETAMDLKVDDEKFADMLECEFWNFVYMAHENSSPDYKKLNSFFYNKVSTFILEINQKKIELIQLPTIDLEIPVVKQKQIC